MQSNYRHHHYLLSSANPATQAAAAASVSQTSQSLTASSAGTSLSLSSSSSSPFTPTSLSPNKLRKQHQQQQQQRQQVHLASSPVSYMNGLPTATSQHTANLCKSKTPSSNWQQQYQQQILPPCTSNCTHLASTQETPDLQVSSQRHSNGNSGRYFMESPQHLSLQPSPLVHRQPMQLRSTSRDYYNEEMPLDSPVNRRVKQQQQQQQQQQFTNNSSNTTNNDNNNCDTQGIVLNKLQQREYLHLHQQQHQQQQFQQQQRFLRHEDQDFYGKDELVERSDVDNGLNTFNQQQKYSPQQDSYTSQIRQLQQRFQQQCNIQSGINSTTSMPNQQQAQQQQQLKNNNSHQQQVSYQQQHRNSASTSCNSSSGKLRPLSPNSSSAASPQSDSSSSAPACLTATNQQQSSSSKKSSAPHHVNFNRSNHVAGGDEDEGDSRKKKYLTAKYGQQQMNLIKKRLKIEMWLYEQLQDLAKGSKSEAALDEIDIDLDQLLDMDGDDTRRHWLKKILEPFEDVPHEKIDKFIGEVLEQSKLL